MSKTSGWLTVGLFAYLVAAAIAIVVFPLHLVEASLSAHAREADALTAAQLAAAITAARQVVLLAAGGVLAVFTLALTQRRDAVARARHEIDRDANRTTRYTEAIKQLGDDKTAVRFGGIYALGRIGEDSDRDRKTIVQVLQAYIVEAAPRAAFEPMKRNTLRRWLDPRSFLDELLRARDARALQAGTARAAVEVVAQLSNGLRPQQPRINLSGTFLSGADLANAHFSLAAFVDADLTRATFNSALLNAAAFDRATLNWARFVNAQAKAASFSNVQADSATFASANLVDTFFEAASLPRAVFAGADLSGAILIGANLQDANFNDANLQGAYLDDAVTAGASFVGADLRGLHYSGDLVDLGDIRGAKIGPLPRDKTAGRRRTFKTPR